MQRTADLSRLPRDTGERRDLTVGRDFAARNPCDNRIDAGVRRHFFTFRPSLLFILCGAPLVEATDGDLKFTAPLTGITAAAVGVVVNLAVFFAWHVLWPAGTDAAPFADGFQWLAAVVSVTTFVALVRFQRDVLEVIGACAGLGLC